MEKQFKTLDSLKENSYKNVFLKSVKKDVAIPDEPVVFEFELYKKGKLMKNKRFFKFYKDKCLFFQVLFLIFFFFKALNPKFLS